MEMRECVKCRKEKPIRCFSVDPRIASGRKVKCFSCEMADNMKWKEKYLPKKEVKKIMEEVWYGPGIS